MLRIQFRIRPVLDFGPFSDSANSSPISSKSSQCPFSFHPNFKADSSHCKNSFFISCKSSHSNSSRRSWNRDDDEFLEAYVLASETVRHYHLRRQGYLEETKWQSSGQFLHFPAKAKESKSIVSPMGRGFLRQFHSPTIFLKIACDGNLLLPIIVGEFAIERLVDAFRGDGHGESPNQFEFVRNLVGTLGYEVKMVRITERVVNTYYACIYFGKPGEKAIVSVDARPSDAINVAIRCKAPIYVSKQIVLTDAIRIIYGEWRGNGVKSIYDVSLDREAYLMGFLDLAQATMVAPEGPDSLAEELELLTKMNIAAQEERYNDAATWRDKLTKLRMPNDNL